MKPVLSHLLRTALAVLAAISLFAAPAHADDTVRLSDPAVLPGESAAQCYADATEHLRHGMWYERAASQLKEAIRQDPKNADYHLALGCAYADRAASIGYAEVYAHTYAGVKDAYQKSLADWQKAQSDPTSADYGKPQPNLVLFVPYTKDDDKPFTLTVDQASAQMAELAREALVEWKEAVGLITNPADRARAEYTEGWGIALLGTYRDITVGGWPLFAGGVLKAGYPGEGVATPLFRSALQDDPKQAIYWESLGDSLTGLLSWGAGNGSKEGLADLRKSLALSPGNSALWFRFYQDERTTDEAQAKSDLKQAALAEPANALPEYLLAFIDFDDTSYKNNAANASQVDLQARYPRLISPLAKQQWSKDLAKSLTPDDKAKADDALQEIEKGNQAPACYLPSYRFPVPDWLSPAWGYMYHGSFFSGYTNLREMGRDLTGYVSVAGINGDVPEAVRAGNDTIAMGIKLMGDWSTQARGHDDPTAITELVGDAIVTMGYRNLIETVKLYGDPGMAQILQSEYDDFRARETAWQTLIHQQIHDSEFGDY